jgi:hypothetical protein
MSYSPYHLTHCCHSTLRYEELFALFLFFLQLSFCGYIRKRKDKIYIVLLVFIARYIGNRVDFFAAYVKLCFKLFGGAARTVYPPLAAFCKSVCEGDHLFKFFVRLFCGEVVNYGT